MTLPSTHRRRQHRSHPSARKPLPRTWAIFLHSGTSFRALVPLALVAVLKREHRRTNSDSDSWQAALVLILAAAGFLAACGASSTTGRQSVGATTPSTSKTVTSIGATTSTTHPTILAPGTAGSFAASPTVVAIGQSITLTGHGCPPEDRVEAGPPSGWGGQIRPRADGSWSITSVVGDQSDIGVVHLFATCVNRQGYAGHYSTITVQVSTYRHLEVQPSTFVHPGDTLTVTAIGSCSVFAMNVGLFKKSGGFVPGQQWQVLKMDPAGVRSGPFVVPATTPGSYFLKADCEDRGYYAAFTPLPVTVLAANVPIPRPGVPAVGREIPVTR